MLAAALAMFLVEETAYSRQAAADPFAFFHPVVIVTQAERQRVDRGEIIARILPARDAEVAVFAVTRLNAEPESLVRWTRAIEALRKTSFLRAIRRFSNPPVLSDLDDLALDDVDLESVRRCRSGDCGLKLAAGEMDALRSVAQTRGQDWKPAVQQEFRRLLFDRIARYQRDGFAGLPAYADRAVPMLPRDVFVGFLERSPHLRRLSGDVDGPGSLHTSELAAESFLYWSKEHYGRGKPLITVTHVNIVRPTGPSLPAVVVLGQELYASHYRDGSLGTTFVVAGDEGGTNYLVYLNRSRVDALSGFLGGLRRTLLEGRLSSEVKNAIDGVRKRLESGSPP